MDRKRDFIPYGKQSIDQSDIDAVVEVLRGDLLTTGPIVDMFEKALADKVGASNAVACSNGTTALHLAMIAAGIGPGDCVIVPSITFLATANVVRYVGAEVVFSDVDSDTGLMSVENAESAYLKASGSGKNVKAIISVHLGGQCADPEALYKFANTNGLVLIEDACHALGTTYRVDSSELYQVGACKHSDFTTFSFHPVKTLTTGEGGAVTCKSHEMANVMRTARSHGMIRKPEAWLNKTAGIDEDGTPNSWYYEMHELGFNFRLTDFQCALGINQLKKLSSFVSKREELRAVYQNMLNGAHPALRALRRIPNVYPGWHLMVVLIDFKALNISRNKVMGRLRKLGVGTQVHYFPVHLQPYYSKFLDPELNLSGANQYYSQCLSLPLYPTMEERDVNEVVHSLLSVLQQS